MNRGVDQSVSRALEALESALEALRAGTDCEVFIRRTARLCVEHEHGRTRVRRGLEEGTAVRLRCAHGALQFGAASGSGLDAVARAQSRARALPASAPTDEPAWSGAGGTLLDLDGPHELPPPQEVEAWLGSAASDARASVDAAVGIEALGTGSGLRALRVRGLVWARLWDGNGVRSAVARRLERLQFADWAEPSEAEGPSLGLPAWQDPRTPLVLLPAAAGALAPALAAVVPPGAVAGPGWVCEDDPADPDAPGGGRFDDTGFLASRLVLADGREVLASPRGPGRRRRLSFREPPQERTAQLRFQPSGSWDGRGLLVRTARVLATGNVWTTLLEIAPAVEGCRVGPWRRCLVRAEPATWVAACRAHIGPVRRTPEGVTSGRLVFQDFRLRPRPV